MKTDSIERAIRWSGVNNSEITESMKELTELKRLAEIGEKTDKVWQQRELDIAAREAKLTHEFLNNYLERQTIALEAIAEALKK